MAYLDIGDGDETFLCLHGEPTWSFSYRKMIPGLSELGRVIVPDFIGFGRSDRFSNPEAYSYFRFYDWLKTFIEQLHLTNITLICQDWGGLLGLPYATKNQDRFTRLVPMNTVLVDGTQQLPDEWWRFREFVDEHDDFSVSRFIQEGTNTELSDDVLAGYDAPFPDTDYKAAAKIWPLLVPTGTDMEGAKIMKEAIASLSEWAKPAFVLFSDSDPIMSRARDPMRELIPTASEQPDVWVEGPGHFLQEEAGETLAEYIVEFVKRT